MKHSFNIVKNYQISVFSERSIQHLRPKKITKLLIQIRDENLLNCCGRRDAKGPKDACNSERSRQELSNEDFVAKLVFDTALLFSCGIFDLINRLASPKTIPQFAKKVVRQLDRLR